MDIDDEITKEENPQTIYFQPTAETERKLKSLRASNPNISLSQLINLIIQEVPDGTKVVFKLEHEHYNPF